MTSADFLAEATSRMRSDGLLVDNPIADGGWHRCQVESASGRRNQDGSYKIVNSQCPIAFWSNWKHGLQGWYCAKDKKAMSRKERAEFEAELARIAEENRKEREAAQAAAAKRAAYIWDNAITTVDHEHGYLKRKQVDPGPCRQASDRRLIMPLYDGKGQLATLQFISAKKREGCSDKLLLKDGRKQGCYCPLPAKPGFEANPLLIAEGFATAMSLHMATGYEVWIAIDCHNLLEVAKLARARYPERLLVICADYDEPLLPNYPGKGGIGAEKGRKAAEAIGAYFALCPVWDGRSKADFNDMYCDLGPNRVRQEIEKALAGRPFTDCIIPNDFILRAEGPEAGLYWILILPNGIPKEIRIGDPLHILGYTRTGEGDNWGVYLEWQDRDGRKHQLALPYSLLTGQRSEWLPLLADSGWRCDSAYRKQIARYLENSTPLKRIRCVTATGWSDGRYILPDCIYGAGEDQIVLQAQGYKDLYQSQGSLEEWQELARLCIGNPKLGFAVDCAFAGPLLKLAGMGGSIFNFEGGSSCGKTTALTAAASVWGNPEKHVEKWRATDNSLEVTASLHNDCLLILDELGEARAKTLPESVYMLAGGQGKKRAAKDGGLRKTYHWNTITLSSGELGLGDKLLEAGRQSRGGLDARFVAIPVSRADIKELHGLKDSSDLVWQIMRLAGKAYGTAGRAFLEKLTEPEFLDQAREVIGGEIEKATTALCPEDSDGQVRRVSLQFALAAFAGTLAVSFGILPEDFKAFDYAAACFDEWLAERGGIGPAEDIQILRQVQRCIELHGMSRFQPTDNPEAYTPNQAGYRGHAEDGAGYVYYCFPEVFRTEIIKGHSQKRAVKVLAAAGWLKTEVGRSTRQKWINEKVGNKRVYVIQIPEGA